LSGYKWTDRRQSKLGSDYREHQSTEQPFHKQPPHARQAVDFLTEQEQLMVVDGRPHDCADLLVEDDPGKLRNEPPCVFTFGRFDGDFFPAAALIALALSGFSISWALWTTLFFVLLGFGICFVFSSVLGAVRNVVGIRCGAISGNMKVSFQAARSIG
jgi:hypothetical protein